MKSCLLKLAHAIGCINRPLLLAGVMVLLVLISVSLTVFFASTRQINLPVSPLSSIERDFIRSPFSLMDAYETCVGEAKSNLGSRLLRSTMLPLSTRYEPKDNSYVVALDVDVGTVHNWESAIIFCSVNPAIQRVTYYKEQYEKEPSVLSRSISFLSKLLE